MSAAAGDDAASPRNVNPTSTAWQQLAGRLEAFGKAWDEVAAASPDDAKLPSIGKFLPDSPPLLRRLVLLELVKIELDRRWPTPARRKALADYAAEFPELLDDGQMPVELVYEEFQVRRRHGDAPSIDDYCRRFPQHAERLRVLSTDNDPLKTTSLFNARKTDVLEIGRQLDDFDLLVTLGEGAFATVYLARQRSLGRIVALKVSAMRGIETQTLAQLDHPYIVRVYDQRPVPEQQLHLMYMQYIAGGTLLDVVARVRQTSQAQRRGRLLLECIDERLLAKGESPPSDSRTRQMLASLGWPQVVCWLGARLASALEHAHARGVLHRDLKPANVLLAADGSPKLADFNVSSSTQAPAGTAEAYFGGSLAYMSPEQLDLCIELGERDVESLDGRSDLYSLGIVLWELLSGERPFRDEGLFDSGIRSMADRRKHGVGEQAIASLPRTCPPGMTDVLLDCLAPGPAARIVSARVLRRRLDLCQHPEVQTLVRPPAGSWLPALRRHPLPLVIVAGLVPNVVASAMSIAYNHAEIIDHLTDERVPRIFELQLVTINPVAYAVGVALIVALAWPVLRAVRRITIEPREAITALERWRLRAPYLGDYVAWVSGAEWFISGLVFPAWLQISLGTAAGLSAQQWVHFFASQVMCGLLASTMSFFCVTLYALRVLCPALLEADRDDAPLCAALDRLARRTPVYTTLALVMVPLAVVVMPLVRTESRMAFLVLGLVGLLATCVAFVLAKKIQQAIAALRLAVTADELEPVTRTSL